MQYSNHASFAFASSVLKELSELIAGLEQRIKDEGATPYPGYDVGPVADGVRPGCIPGFTCDLTLSTLEGIMQEAGIMVTQVITEGLKLTGQARGLGISQFDTRFSTLLGPAPDRGAS